MGLRETKTEKGKVYGQGYDQTYTCTYTQPVYNLIISELYHHIWEKLTWRIYRKIEKLTNQNKRFIDSFDEVDVYIPLTNRQDIRCDHLRQKNRIVVGTEYGPRIKRPGF